MSLEYAYDLESSPFPGSVLRPFAVQHRHLFGHVAFTGYGGRRDKGFHLREILCGKNQIKRSQGFLQLVACASADQRYDILAP